MKLHSEKHESQMKSLEDYRICTALVLDIILRNSKRLTQLTEDILDVTKIESGAFHLKTEKFDFNKMIIELMDEYLQTINGTTYLYTMRVTKVIQ